MRTLVAIAPIAFPLLCACGSADEPARQGAGVAAGEVTAQIDDAVQLRPGQYESETEILDFALTGLPQEQADAMAPMMRGGFATRASFCLTPEEAARGPEQMGQELADANCSYDRFEFSGGRMSAEMRCTGEGGEEGRYVLDGEMNAESSTVSMTIDQPMPGMPGAAEGARMTMRVRVSSHRTGECA